MTTVRVSLLPLPPNYDHASCLNFLSFFFLSSSLLSILSIQSYVVVVAQMRRLSGQNSTPTTLPSPCQQTERAVPGSTLRRTRRGEARSDTHRPPRPIRLRSSSQTRTQSRPCRTSTRTNRTTMTRRLGSTTRTAARSPNRSNKPVVLSVLVSVPLAASVNRARRSR